MNQGTLCEELVEHLCTRSFFSDFTFRSPKYKKSGGQLKEAADVLIVFGKTVLGIQVKSKEVGTEQGTISAVEQARVVAKLEEAVLQFKALREAIENPEFKSLVNGHGVEVEFQRENICELVLVVVFVPLAKVTLEMQLDFGFVDSCYTDAAIPLHFFTLHQFSTLLTMLDTLPDFLRYLDARWLLRREKLISKDTDPLDEWAFVSFERTRFLEVLGKGEFVNLTACMSRHRDSVQRLEEAEKPSYMIDDLIKELQLSAGTEIMIGPELRKRFRLSIEPNSVCAHQLLVPYLAKLDRSERCVLGERFEYHASRCKDEPLSFAGIVFPKHDEGYFVLASTSSRSQRQVELHNLCMAYAVHRNLKTIIGLAGSPAQTAFAPWDAMVLDTSSLQQDAKLCEVSRSLFGPPCNPEGL